MKKPFIYLISMVLLIACNNQKSIPIDTPETLKKNQFIGTFVEVSRKITRGKEDRVTEYYFRMEDKNYFIKFKEGYVSKEEMLKYLNQKVVVKGETKTGEWEDAVPGSLSNLESPKQPRQGDYIAIYKIYK